MTKNNLIAGLLAAMMLLGGCRASSSSKEQSSSQAQEGSDVSSEAVETIEVEDSEGMILSFDAAPERVVVAQSSLAGIWLLSGRTLAGISDDADEHGISTEGVGIIGTTKSPNAEIVLKLFPDLVIFSPDVEGQAQMAQAVGEAGIPTYACKVDGFADYLEALADFCEINSTPELYEQYGTAVQQQIDAVVEKAKAAEDTPSVLFLRAYSSGVKAKARDQIACDIMIDMGVDNIAARNDSLLEELNMEIILQEDPDYVLIVTMGDDTEKTIANLQETLFSNPAWESLTAVKSDRVIYLPKDLFHYKPNERWGEAYEYLYNLLFTS